MRTEAHLRSLVETLGGPVLIMSRQGQIYFINSLAERMLSKGLKDRLQRHLSRKRRPPVSQVKFHLETGEQRVLRIRLSDIKLMGKPAVQVSLKDVTPHIAAAQPPAEQAAPPCEMPEKPPPRARVESQLKGLIAAQERTAKRLEDETAELERAKREGASLRQQLAESRRTEEALQAARVEIEAQGRLHADQLAGAREQLARESAELKHARDEIEELRLWLARGGSAEEHEQLLRQVSEAERVCEELRADGRTLAERAEQGAEELASANLTLRQQLEELERLRDANRRMEGERAASGRTAEEFRSRCQALEGQLRELPGPAGFLAQP